MEVRGITKVGAIVFTHILILFVGKIYDLYERPFCHVKFFLSNEFLLLLSSSSLFVATVLVFKTDVSNQIFIAVLGNHFR